uniref:Uncharacterized protein n=1 Tax=Setaria viridis TaxID=4556 RepID=A0A4U6W022_SETVI|nr:hypothetical protein SEVIR_2G327500v2 [Setaria viridis]
MQLRSGRRLVPSRPSAAPQGGARRGCPRRRPEEGDGGGEDRLSGLPEELILEVLDRLGCAREAARTSGLSRRWRGLWTHLPVLTFDGMNPDSLGGALARVRPERNRLVIRISPGATLSAARVSSLLNASARIAPKELVVELDRYSRGVRVKLPRLIQNLASALSALSEAGKFAALESLALVPCCVDPSDLLPLCPCLRRFEAQCHYNWTLDTLEVHSESLEELVLGIQHRSSMPQHVNIATPMLKKFMLRSYGFRFAMSFLAPKVEEFSLEMECGLSRVGFGEKWHLLWLSMRYSAAAQSFTQSFAQEIARLPVSHFSVLELRRRTEGHGFGALFGECLKNCDCDQASNWRNEHISLPNLQVVEFEGFHGADHEVDFLKFLFQSAPMLKRLTIELSAEISPDIQGCQELCSILKANASVKCYVYDRSGQKISFA